VNIVNPGLDKKKRPKSPFSVWISWLTVSYYLFHFIRYL
jgi:hypothetical protein